MKVTNIIWSFEETEFEGLNYKEAVKLAALPNKIIIEDIDDDLDEEDIYEHINEYIQDNYNLEVESFDFDYSS